MVKRKKAIPAKARHPTVENTNDKKIIVVNSGYSEGGASRTRSTLRVYNPLKSSTKADVDVNLATLRNRSSDLVCNSPLGSSAINTSRSNVIGAGLKVSPKIDYRLLGLTAEEAKEWQRQAFREFNLWANSTACDLYRKNNFFDMQDIAYMSYLVDGDGWAAIKYRRPLPDNPYCVRIQLFEASRVCNPNSSSSYGSPSYYDVEMKNEQNGNRIINGIEIDADGAVVGYWIANRVPFDLTNPSALLKWQRVEAYGKLSGRPNILQISHEERPEQYRGVPILAPVIEVLKQVSRYTNAELTAAIIKSFYTLFFTTNNNIDDMNDVLSSTYGQAEAVTPEDLAHVEVGPGTLNLLPPGVDVKSMDASRTMSTFEPFTNMMISQIGAAIGTPAEVLLSRFQSSYSAARGALLQAASNFKTRRTWFARDFCQPVYEAWLAEAVAIGRISAPGYGSDPIITKAWSNADWFGPVMGMLDPVKEVTGAALRVKYGFSTGERESAELTGTDYDSNIDQIAIEQQTWRAKGLEPPKADNTGGSGGDNDGKILAGEE